ncbi:MAG TPA: ABC transporter permease [Gemmataceae bacterium]|nr:ABC transporter permease [Gemmataceae bacterium]
MRKMLVVAVREYLAAVRTKAFLITLIIMPVLMSGSIVVQWLLRDYHDTKTKKFVVVDRTPGARLYPAIAKTIQAYNEKIIDPATHKAILPHFDVESAPASASTADAIAQQRLELSERVRKGELFGFLDIGPDVLEPSKGEAGKQDHVIRYQSNSPTNHDFPRLIEKSLLFAIQDVRLDIAHLGAMREKIREIMKPTPVEAMGLSHRNPATGAIEDASLQDRIAPVAVPIGFLLLMFMVIMMTATPLMQNVVEEKMQRIAEVLLASVRPFDLMLGKLLGMTAVSLTITAVYLGGAYGAARQYGFAEYIPPALLAWFVVYQAFGLLMYGSLFIAVGAACTDMKETQNLMWPVMLLILLPMFLMGPILQEPNSTLAVSLSFFPFATPMLMIVRQSVPPGVPSWQPFLGVGLVMLATLLCVWAAGRIFRVGILMQGKGAKLDEMLRWVFHG